MAVIELEDIHKSYGSHAVLTGMDLEIRDGEIFGVLGPNGVGKTTLFQTILGLLRLDDGQIHIDGAGDDRGKQVRRQIGYLPSDISFYESKTAMQNLEYFARLAGTEPDLRELLELVGLGTEADRPVGEFSTGMKKRLGIAQAMIKDPPIVIFDEPTTGLDPEGKRAFKDLVVEINEERDMTVVISSHVTTEIDSLCDRFAILKEGNVVACGTKDELAELTDADYHIRIESDDIEAARSIVEEMGYEHEVDDDQIVVVSPDDIRSELFSRLADADVPIRTLDLEEQTLETTYLELTEG